MEHNNAQMMLYTLLMFERYSRMIDYGVLYYLTPNQTQIVQWISVIIKDGDSNDLPSFYFSAVYRL
nr:DNA replication ATP-dependent helicase/nuclease DNA2 [Ipomoea batatas]GMD18344.1 DNA replication ATP-dependent helicase/nuclease DNA2 [Ipomoea batatas]GMD21298.1 DNA replication ATP-dependent helicase/nuclease DNA2 [Ipomoea batatas]